MRIRHRYKKRSSDVDSTDLSYEEFKRRVNRLNEPRTPTVTGSLGVRDAYCYNRKNKWQNLPRCITQHEYHTIIRKVNKLLVNNILEGEFINFPCRMGRVELKKFLVVDKVINGKIVSYRAVDWDKTIKLWYEDKEAYSKRTLVRTTSNEGFKVVFNRYRSNCNNIRFFTFILNRDVKRSLSAAIKEGRIDAIPNFMYTRNLLNPKT